MTGKLALTPSHRSHGIDCLVVTGCFVFVIKAQVEPGALDEVQPFLHTVQVSKVMRAERHKKRAFGPAGEGECGMRISW